MYILYISEHKRKRNPTKKLGVNKNVLPDPAHFSTCFPCPQSSFPYCSSAPQREKSQLPSGSICHIMTRETLQYTSED